MPEKKLFSIKLKDIWYIRCLQDKQFERRRLKQDEVVYVSRCIFVCIACEQRHLGRSFERLAEKTNKRGNCEIGELQ